MKQLKNISRSIKSKMVKYKQYDWAKEKYPIVGKLTKTGEKVGASGKSNSRTGRNSYVYVPSYIDESGQIFIRMFGVWWKYPEQVEH
jgi:hypothetical protein